MAYDCRVYRILIASPSDVDDEREIAVRVIHAWNDLHSYGRKLALFPLRWETHTAPDYGSRPQEVINRAIVDDCDLLVGIFWTRIGSPTGMADSGTLEEIERVGKAGKPIMLYFSSVGADPDKIDPIQIERLKEFKTITYPKALVEKYKSHIEFRDKFTSQLEIKIRELQRTEASGTIPLSLEFLSDKGEPGGGNVIHTFDHLNVADLGTLAKDDLEKVEDLVAATVRGRAYFPVALAIENSSPSGIRNLYGEINFSATSGKVELTERPLTSKFSETFFSVFSYKDAVSPSPVTERIEATLAKFEEGTLQHANGGWRLSFEWDALQPQRVRLVKPVLYLYSPEPARMSIKVKIFAESFPGPVSLEANVILEPTQVSVALADLLPNWKEIISRAEPERFYIPKHGLSR
jgi:hypothetical protein